MNFHFRDDEAFAGRVQISRLARSIKKQLRPDASHDECLDLASRLLGCDSYYDLRKRATDPDIRGWDRKDAVELLESEAIKRGSRFPGKLPSRFDLRWQRQAFQLFEEALGNVRRGALEAVALVGPSGSGKTLLAAHVVDQKGGYIVDVGQASLMDMQRLRFKESDRVLVFDQSSEPAPEFWEGRGFDDAFRAPSQLSTLSALAKARRVRHTVLPLDSYRDVGMMGAGSTTLRDRLAKHPGLVLVVTFATEDEAVNAIRSTARIVSGNPELTYERNWQRVHVVSLEEMRRTTIDLAQAPSTASLGD
ncbi:MULTISPECIES: hypothetical protein [Delftia]|jgi:hypothetical protein|uniref:hypothetical protein n=1 Tax=Delftia TaxID=80865 RepID=UPI000B489F71|nr:MULTISPECIES: hypothetical protein [Delftia]OWG12359.1 ATP-binding protein [Delftia sp. K82]